MSKNRPETPKRPIRLLVTAGPTHEPIDAVRYIANRSSGRMGMSLVQAGLTRGWSTTLLLGPTTLPAHDTAAQVLRFRSASDLSKLLQKHVPECDVLIMAAAVADYRPIPEPSGTKMRRGDEPISLPLEPVPDLLAGLREGKRSDQYFVGFALEPRDELIERARGKLAAKGLDAIVGNPLETMDSAEASGVVIIETLRGIEEEVVERCSKEEFGERVVDVISEHVSSVLSNV